MFNRLINRSYMAEERISENKDLSIETSKTEMQLKKKKKTEKKKEQNIQELWDYYEKHIICIMTIAEGEKRKEQKKHLRKVVT